MLLDLANGRVDGVVSDIPGMEYSFIKMKDLGIAERIKTGEQYGLMMTKDHPLLGKVNDAISAMKKDGSLAAIHKKWFGTDAAPAARRWQRAPFREPDPPAFALKREAGGAVHRPAGLFVTLSHQP